MNTTKKLSHALTALILAFLTCNMIAAQDAMPPEGEGKLIATVGNAQLTLIEKVKLATRDAGIVDQILVREGEAVSANQRIIQLDSALYQAEADSARVEVEIADIERQNKVDYLYAKKSADVNKKLLVRSQDAYKQYEKSVSKTELDRLELELEKSVLSGDQAQHQMEVNELTFEKAREKQTAADIRLGYRQINTPIDGVVAEVLTQKGEWVAAGQTIARIINPSVLRVEVLVNQRLVFQIKPGQRVVFENSFGKLKAEGVVTFVSPEVNPFNETIRVWAEINNGDRKLLPGFKGTINIYDAPLTKVAQNQAGTIH